MKKQTDRLQAVLSPRAYDTMFASLQAEIARNKRRRRMKDAAWGVAAVLGFVALLMVAAP